MLGRALVYYIIDLDNRGSIGYGQIESPPDIGYSQLYTKIHISMAFRRLE
jgi:hypothetical protein